eukprot:6847599-Prymnesium_polylepis.2
MEENLTKDRPRRRTTMARAVVGCLLLLGATLALEQPPRDAAAQTSPAAPASDQTCRWEWKKLRRVCEAPPPPPPPPVRPRRGKGSRKGKPEREPNWLAFGFCVLVFVAFRLTMHFHRDAMGIGVRRKQMKLQRDLQVTALKQALAEAEQQEEQKKAQ